MSLAVRFLGSDPWHRLSDCGRYRIAKVHVMGVERYEVWFKADGTLGFKPIKHNLPNYDAAKAHAAEHAELCSSRKEAFT